MPNKQKILIAEDNPDGREIIVLFVKSLGLEVFEATTGLQALNQTRAVHPDAPVFHPNRPAHDRDSLAFSRRKIVAEAALRRTR